MYLSLSRRTYRITAVIPPNPPLSNSSITRRISREANLSPNDETSRPPLARRRVVVTGLGMVSPLGLGVEENWNKLINGTSGITNITRFDAAALGLPSQIAGEVPDIERVWSWVPSQIKSEVPPCVAYAISAAQQAIQDSAWNGDRNTAGVAIGCGMGSLGDIMSTHDTFKQQGYRRVSPYFIPRILNNMSSGYVSIIHGFKGPNHSVSTACATGAHAIGDAASFIERGMASAMLAGATEASIVSLAVAGFCRTKALSTSFNKTPTLASRPFDSKRDGFVIAEGAGILMLEDYQSALERGAKIYGEVRGYGLSGEGHHITQPTTDGNAARRCMEMALTMAGVKLNEVDYINAHATSTPLGDKAEVKAITDLFGEHAKKISISSTKGATGHLLGAAGAVEAIFTLLALKEGIIPPTLNLSELDRDITTTQSFYNNNDALDFTPNVAKKRAVNVALTNSFGFGGTNASLVFAKHKY